MAVPATRLSRRAAVLLAAGTAALGACGTGDAPVARTVPSGAPAAPPPKPEFPLPVGLAEDASPEFRAVADALVAAMRAGRIPRCRAGNSVRKSGGTRRLRGRQSGFAAAGRS